MRREDETKHDAAVRGAQEVLGISWGWIQERAGGMPLVGAKGGVTLFCYDLVLPLQELTRPTWGERASAQRAASVGGVAADLLRELEESARGRAWEDTAGGSKFGGRKIDSYIVYVQLGSSVPSPGARASFMWSWEQRNHPAGRAGEPGWRWWWGPMTGVILPCGGEGVVV